MPSHVRLWQRVVAGCCCCDQRSLAFLLLLLSLYTISIMNNRIIPCKNSMFFKCIPEALDLLRKLVLVYFAKARSIQILLYTVLYMMYTQTKHIDAIVTKSIPRIYRFSHVYVVVVWCRSLNQHSHERKPSRKYRDLLPNLCKVLENDGHWHKYHCRFVQTGNFSGRALAHGIGVCKIVTHTIHSLSRGQPCDTTKT